MRLSKSFWAIIILQLYMILFLLLHDWVKIGPFTDPVGFGDENTLGEAIFQTAVNTLPILIGFILTLIYMGKRFPLAAKIYICLLYPIYMFGEFQAWWLPYFFGKTLGRDFDGVVERYEVMFGNTHAFLPPLNGIVINTAHVILHLSTVLVFLLFLYIFRSSGSGKVTRNKNLSQ
ncbi:hypothetical protein [Pseudoneobacillus sp. C159]